jgi:intein-encoded DNA endonuclease-like protein
MLLSVTDQDFAQEFSRCLAKILSRRKYYVVRWSEKRQRWIVQGRSMLLHDFLNRSWEELKPAIEHDEKCTCSFLRAFFDGEGCVSGRTISVSNTDLGLLSYVQQLLRRLDIDTGSIVLGTRSGRKFNDPRTGKTYFTKKDCYSFHIRAHSVETFAARVGFTIERKADRLRKIDPRKVSTLI